MGRKETIGVGLIGAGTVGGGVIRELNEHGEDQGLRLEAVLIDDPTKDREFPADYNYTTDKEEIFNKPDVDIVIELTGVRSAASEYADRAFASEKDFITANKELMAYEAKTKFASARKMGRNMGFEATVGGKIPIMAALRYFDGEDILSIDGIPNGSTNYVFTSMFEDGLTYDEALQLAEDRKLVEPNPDRDVQGLDARDKIIFLASLAWNTQFNPEEITPQGITGVTLDDMDIASWIGTMRRRKNRKRGPGYSIKPMVVARKQDNEEIEVWVSPALVSNDNPLSKVKNEQNSLRINTRNGTPITIEGPGAGREATTSAVMADLRRLADYRRRGIIEPLPTLDGGYRLLDPNKSKGKWYLRFSLKDVTGSIRRFGEVLERHDLSIQHSIQDEDPQSEDYKSDFVTFHPATREQVIFASEELDETGRVTGPRIVLPIVN